MDLMSLFLGDGKSSVPLVLNDEDDDDILNFERFLFMFIFVSSSFCSLDDSLLLFLIGDDDDDGFLMKCSISSLVKRFNLSLTFLILN